MIATSNALAANSALEEALSVVDIARSFAPEDGTPTHPGMTVDQAAYTICNVLKKLKLDLRGRTGTRDFSGETSDRQGFQGVGRNTLPVWNVANLDSLINKFKRLTSANVGHFDKQALFQVRQLSNILGLIVENH